MKKRYLENVDVYIALQGQSLQTKIDQPSFEGRKINSLIINYQYIGEEELIIPDSSQRAMLIYMIFSHYIGSRHPKSLEQAGYLPSFSLWEMMKVIVEVNCQPPMPINPATVEKLQDLLSEALKSQIAGLDDKQCSDLMSPLLTQLLVEMHMIVAKALDFAVSHMSLGEKIKWYSHSLGITIQTLWNKLLPLDK